MRDRDTRLTAQQEEFARLVVEEGHSYVSAYALSYPPRQGQRSREAIRVAGKRLAKRPGIRERMQEIRDQLRASDPVELRRRANAVLAAILAERQDPRYRRTALDVLRYLDSQERAVEKAEQASLRTALDQLALLDAIEGRGGRRHLRARRRASEMSQERAEPDAGWEQPAVQNHWIAETDADGERRRAEIDEVIAARRRMRLGG
jgi:hypothetical protein